jgi:pimeloyl-ACP methyl ester carboxylesterase
MITKRNAEGVICVHGICRHHEGYEQCWGASIKHHLLPEDGDFDFIPVMWNRTDDPPPPVPNANCGEPFPSGWITVNAVKGFIDAVRYVSWRQPNIAFREEAIKRCVDAITGFRGDKLHIIGHSLGSVIAYQALHRLNWSVKVATFISVGAVLNFDYGVVPLLEHETDSEGKEKLPRPLADRWINIMDTKDFCYLVTEEKMEQRVELDSTQGDHDITENIHGDMAYCPAMRTVDLPEILSEGLEIDKQSICSHLYYFSSQSPASQMIANVLKGNDP